MCTCSAAGPTRRCRLTARASTWRSSPTSCRISCRSATRSSCANTWPPDCRSSPRPYRRSITTPTPARVSPPPRRWSRPWRPPSPTDSAERRVERSLSIADETWAGPRGRRGPHGRRPRVQPPARGGLMAAQPHFRAGMVGAGNICEYHVAAVQALPDVELVGICDLDRRARRGGRGGVGHAGLPVARGAGRGGRERDPCAHAAERARWPSPSRRSSAAATCWWRSPWPRARRTPAASASCAESKGLVATVDHSLLYDPQVLRALEQVRAGLDRKGRRRRHLPQLRVPALRGRPAAAPVPRRRLPVARPRRALPLHDPGAARDDRRRRGRAGGASAAIRNLAFDEWRALVRCERGLGQFQLSWNTKPMQSQMIDPRHVRRPAGRPVCHVPRPSLGHAAAEGGRARGQRLRRVAQAARGRAARSVEVPARGGAGVPGAARPRGRLLPAARRRGAAACHDRGRGRDRRVDREGGPRSGGRPRRRARPLRAAAHG